jgi:hypothetical protein
VKRAAALGALWTASAAAAVGLGFLAVSLVGASASPTAPRTGLASTPTPAGPNPSGEQTTVGGTVYATCASGAPHLASAPAPGWQVDGSAHAGTVEFRDATRKVEVHVTCAGGTPSFTVEGPRSAGGGSSPASSSAPSSAASTSGGGRGSGSDDSGADDSSGRGGGGHGSDG